jgi:hypothetical protein
MFLEVLEGVGGPAERVCHLEPKYKRFDRMRRRMEQARALSGVREA